MRISDWSSDVCSSDLFRNQPVRMDGDYWVESDFQYGDVPHPTHVLLQIDPATTSKTSSDYYGVAVIAFDRETRKCVVWYCRQFKLSPKVMRKRAIEICELFPQIGRIRVEARSEEHTSELQSLMRISYAVFCLKKKRNNQ